ncbi:hypothetical protein [Pontibacter virosus]|nr:hypothetical protein [Pontibacter virosus]
MARASTLVTAMVGPLAPLSGMPIPIPGVAAAIGIANCFVL